MTDPTDNLQLDTAALRRFSDELWDEYRSTIEPWLGRIQATMIGAGSSDHRYGIDTLELGRTLGAGGGQYLGTAVGLHQATNIGRAIEFLTDLVAGLRSASIGLSVYVDAIGQSDDAAADEITATLDPTRRDHVVSPRPEVTE